jgi:hypothetical protein
MIITHLYKWYMRTSLFVLFVSLGSCDPPKLHDNNIKKNKTDSVAFADSISNLELTKQQQIANSLDSSKKNTSPNKKPSK